MASANSSSSIAPRDPVPHAILLAAGKGTRMNSDLPKVVHEVAGEPMIRWVVRAAAQAGVQRCVVIVGHRAELVREALGAEGDDDSCTFEDVHIDFALQQQQLGTGHAAAMARPYFENRPASVFVLCGDGPLIRPETLVKLLDMHRRKSSSATLATAVLDDPSGYGRVVRDAHDGSFMAIVEQKDADAATLAIREVNPSYYCFDSVALFDELANLKNNNMQGEYYLTDVPGQLKARGATVAVIDAVPPEDVLSINTTAQLAEVDAVLRRRLSVV
jgi:bifunctional UDP-N-acetylglucosamine pyrophosphorylase/glucosamine-1-phosphate N-acetyltransferase